ncbi:MAG: Dabb family protein [Bacteroidota bacterium]|nr:Dabb family protein [Bacteroidota bacterium]
MVTHLVFIQLKNEYSLEQKKNAIEEIALALKELPKDINEIKYYEVVVNEIDKKGSSEIGLISKFESYDTLNIYRNHSKHLEAVETILKHKQAITSFDYTTSESIYKNNLFKE